MVSIFCNFLVKSVLAFNLGKPKSGNHWESGDKEGFQVCHICDWVFVSGKLCWWHGGKPIGKIGQ